ncbi:MAG: S1 RNA-binding domain-containing protein [Anaerolineaceae bacterium]|nr:S1 RNA-binding domain-containing protein [Anaerolineaceae bacterium]
MESKTTTTEVEHADEVNLKQKYTGKVSKLGLAGALIDIGIKRPAVLHISQIASGNTEESLKRVEDALKIGQEVEVWVRKLKSDHIELTMIQPLELEWREIKTGMSVKGTITRLEKFGAFVEIGAERPGLVHISELAHGYVRTPSEVVKEGDQVEAQVLDVNRRKKQIKLSLKALQPEPEVVMAQVNAESTAPAPSQDKNKPRRKAARKERNKSEFSSEINLSEVATTEPNPTAMEMAWQAAMEKAKTRHNGERSKKERSASHEQEDIISRTLEHKSQHN